MSGRPTKPTTTAETRERRARVRMALAAHVTLREANGIRPVGDAVAGHIGNLSTGGTYVQCPRPFPPDTPCLVSFTVHDNGTEHLLTIPAWVTHTHGRGMGIQFDRLDGKTHALLTRQVNRILFGPG